jgi:two-component system response regulator
LKQNEAKVILLIEDDLGDQKLIKRSIGKFDSSIKIITFSDGEEAVRLFESLKLNKSKIDLPDLILLDLNLPKANGLTILKLIKLSKDFKKIPVVALTTSNADTDVNNCYENFASGYIRKPTTITEFELLIENILNYWFESCILPAKGQTGIL